MSANFRKIRPLFGDSSASTSTPSQSTSESTGSDPLRNQAETEIVEGSSTSSKRRRVPDSVTRNACLNCKKARAKCDGKKPCKRCATRVEASECIYEIHVKNAKEELVKQIKELRAKDHLTEQILQALSTDEKVPEILDRLKNGEAYENIVEWLGRSTIEDYDTLSPRGSHHSTFETEDHAMGGAPATSRWTVVMSDNSVLDHLFQLYFAWVHPVHTLFSEGHFVDSYKRQSRTYCSSVLVNAICAMACHLHTTAEGDEVDFDQLAGEFSNAARATINPADQSITTTQAFAVLFLVDCARANALRASSYLQIATNSLPDITYQEDDGFTEVLKNTVRGIRNLTIEWSQITFQVPPTVHSASYEEVEDNDDKLDEAKWYFYRYVNDQCPAWPGLLATTNREKAKLTAIIQDISIMLYSQHPPQISARQVLQKYSRLVAWRQDLPAVIGNIEDNNSQALPHVLSLLILYTHAVIQLLRPLLDFEGFPSQLVEDTVWNHAQQGLFLLDGHYRTQYTCRYQPVLQMFIILHLSDTIARFFPGGAERGSKDGPEAIHFGIDSLQQSRMGFPVAAPLQDMLRKTATECSIRLPQNPTEVLSTQQILRPAYQMDDFINACTRPSYCQPTREIHFRYLSSISADWINDGASSGFLQSDPEIGNLRVPSAEERGAQSLMQIRNLLNTS